MATASSDTLDSGIPNEEERAGTNDQGGTRGDANPSTTGHRVGSVLTVLATVLATLGSVALGAWLTASAEDARADKDFAREQRIETYGEFLGSIDTSRALMLPFLPTEEQFRETPLEDLDVPTAEQYAEIVESIPPLTTLSGQISIIGGKQVPGQASQVATDVQGGAAIIGAIYRCHNEYADWGACTQPPSALFSPPMTPEGPLHTYLDFPADREVFLRSVTNQLGLPES